jgi:hypothetical protein
MPRCSRKLRTRSPQTIHTPHVTSTTSSTMRVTGGDQLLNPVEWIFRAGNCGELKTMTRQAQYTSALGSSGSRYLSNSEPVTGSSQPYDHRPQIASSVPTQSLDTEKNALDFRTDNWSQLVLCRCDRIMPKELLRQEFNSSVPDNCAAHPDRSVAMEVGQSVDS